MSWIQFRQQVNELLDKEELRTLCFDLNVDYDSLRGEGKADKIRELIALLRRNGRFPELVTRLEEIRPNTDWQALIDQIPDIDEAPQADSQPPIPNSKSSWLMIGAGLLIIVLLVVSLLLASLVLNNSGDDTVNNAPAENTNSTNTIAALSTTASTVEASCLDQYFADITQDRQDAIEVGDHSYDSPVPEEDRTSSELTEPYGIKLTKNGEMIGAVIFRFRAQGELFKIISVADKTCQPVTGYRNVTRTSEDTLDDSDVLEMPLNSGVYTLRPNFQATHIRFSFQEVVSGE